MDKYIFDIETDNLLDKITKIHCLSYCNIEDGVIISTADYREMREFFSGDAVYIGHNVIRFDIPAVEKILGISVGGRKIDTLALSWYISPERNRHGLEGYGEEFGVLKPKISDWSNLSSEEYIHRCEEDVKINFLMWKQKYRLLMELYEENEREINRLLNYLSFKMDCIAEQEKYGIRLNVEHASRMLYKLQGEKEIKIEELTRAIPKVPVISLKMPPRTILRKDGELTSAAISWYALLSEKGLPKNYEEPIEIVRGYEDPNPNSHDQLKKWLYSLGWVPEHIKHVRDKKKGTVKQIPQIASKEGGGEICDSIKKLYDKEPALELLNGLSVLSHRISIFKAFLEDSVDGILYPTIAGFTNTLRMQHKTIVNLPGIDKKYGEDIRACLIPFEGCVLLGSDLSNVEDRSKRHFIYPYDPEYVETMNTPGYDAHLELALLANMMSPEEAEYYKNCKDKSDKEYTRLYGVRWKAKTTNFSATYKVGAPTLARNNNWKLSEAKNLLRIYWERNKSILKVENSCRVREIRGSKWLLNPISGYWYSLRSDKDRFSTLNQGTAAYIFDIWLTYIRRQGMIVNFQYHDELVANVKIGAEETSEAIVNEAITLTNEKLKLNVEVGCSVHFGYDYSCVH